MLDQYTVQRMNALCIKMLESITTPEQRFSVVSETMLALQEMKKKGEDWAKNPKIPFSMGSMDERDLDERIADNTKIIAIIECRIASLNLWLR